MTPMKVKLLIQRPINSAVSQLEAKSFFEGPTIPLHLRTAWSNNHEKDAIYYDMSDEKNRCVKIIPDGWTILDNQTDILFRRYHHQIPQIEPTFVDSLDGQDDVFEQFMTLLNLKIIMIDYCS